MKDGFINVSWSILKGFINQRNLYAQYYVDESGNYNVFAFEGGFGLSAFIPTDGSSDTDKTDFETNYKPQANLYAPSGYYATYVNLRQSAATAAGATVWSLRNPAASTRNVFIERINLIMSFDAGTPLGRALLRYRIRGFGGATPTAGTAQTPANLDTNNATSVVTDIRAIDTGLTVTSVNFGTIISIIGCPASDGAVSHYRKDRDDYVAKLSAGEGICIQLDQTAIVGQGLTGEIVWRER